MSIKYLDYEAFLSTLQLASPMAIDGIMAHVHYPSLAAFVDTEGDIRWCAKEVNQIANKCYFQVDKNGYHWMMPYFGENGLVVHTEPPMLIVGKTIEAGFGVDPDPKWEAIASGINPKVVKVIKNYMLYKSPVFW